MEYISLIRDFVYGQQRFVLVVEGGSIMFPVGYWDYGVIVDTLIKERYPTDKMEAVVNNYFANQGDMDSAQAYTEMLQYRGECKVLARKLLRDSVDNVLALSEFIEAFEPIENTRAMVLQKIQNYDMSNDVNGFIVNEMQVWLTKPQRESLLTSINMFVKAGEDTFPFVLGGMAMSLPCSTLEAMLSSIEVYATQCMMVTSQHTANVLNLKTEEDILNYDYTQGYPEKLSFDF